MKDELARRQTNTDRLRTYFLERPGQWIPWRELEAASGGPAWRTRASDLRIREHMNIEWNGKVTHSGYRYVPTEPRQVDTPGVLFDLGVRS